MKQRKLNIITIDINQRLSPDAVGSTLYLPFSDECFDVVACYEVLEHLPYQVFSVALEALRRVSSSHVLISLPDLSRRYRVHTQLPRLGEIRRIVELPRRRPPRREFDGEHYWNIGTEGYPLRRIVDGIRTAGFQVAENYIVFEVPWHWVLVLRMTRRGSP